MQGLTKILVLLFVILIIPAFGEEDEKIEVGIDEQLGSYIPLDVVFKDANGIDVVLSELVNEPTVLAFVYYECPGICSPLLFELSDVINKSDLEPGYDYNVICISMDELETPEIAAEKKLTFFTGLDKDVPKEAWKFLTGSKEEIKTVTEAAGFYFKRKDDQFLHTGAFIFLDKQGKICRYLIPNYSDKSGFGILPFDFKMAVLEAAEGKVTPTIARVLQFCFSYDSEGQKYTLNFTRIFGAGIVVLVVLFLIFIVFKPKKEIIKAR
jgi:protein SCO1/2